MVCPMYKEIADQVRNDSVGLGLVIAGGIAKKKSVG